jgi:aspartyl-tRNA(Asn)/glutamyl-tRNA(Gln) amidotransferase subunit B
VQETRLYDPVAGETRPMRTKEDAQDYRYFPDPDLLPLVLGEADVERARAALPELPEAMRLRFVREFGLPDYDARTLTSERSLAEYFEAVAAAVKDRKAASNWVMGEVLARLNDADLTVEHAGAKPLELATLINRVTDGTLNRGSAKKLFDEIWSMPRDAVREEVKSSDWVDAEIEKRGLAQISDVGEIERLVDEVLATNAQQVADYRAGKEKALNALVGQVMKASRGKANPAQVNELLRRKLAG